MFSGSLGGQITNERMVKLNKKRLFAAATAAACFASTFAVMPQKMGMQTFAVEAVRNDFEVTYEGWHTNDDISEVTAIEGAGVDGSRGMMVTGRTAPEVGAASSKGFYLWGGTEYDYSVRVKADTDEVFHISLLYKDEETEEETTVQLATKKANAGEWTEIKSSFKAPLNTFEYLITITTESTNDFCFDDVIITTEDSKGLLEAKAVAGEGLKDVFKGYGFRVGNILNGGTIRNSAITANFLKDYNAVECENETKADAVLRQNGSTDNNINVSLDNCAAIADFAEKNGLAFRGHAFVWHSQTPAWFLKENFNGNGNWVSPSVMDVRLESYIKNVFAAFERQYPTLNLYAYDVCNECISDDSNRTANNGGAREPGDNNVTGGKSAYVAVYGDNSFIEKAFSYARKYAPEGCKLYYNDYNEYWDHKRDSIINTILKPLSAKGLLDGMGMQSHVDAGATTFSGTQNYLKAMDMFLDLGIDVQVTELDISLDNGQTLQDQATKYTAIAKHIVEVNTSGKYKGKVTLFQVWGPNDANTWISGDKSPTLYDKNNQPKVAYTQLKSYGESLPEGPIADLDGGGGYTEPELDADGYWFHHTFESSTDGWDGRGGAAVESTGGAKYAGSKALHITDRTDGWNGGQYTLNRAFKAGEEYSFSANFYYDEGTAVTRDFKLTLEYTEDGETQWAEIASASAGSGQWVQLANTSFKLPANGSGFKIIVETTDDTLDNFYIDEVIGAPKGTKIDGAGQPQLPADPSKVLPGDTDLDGRITALDMVNERKAVLGKIDDAAILKAADVDQSSKVEVNDLVLLSEYLLGKIKEFPVNKPPVAEPDAALVAKFSGININTSYKKDGENNCLYTQRFGADPGWLVYDGRLYVYTTNDAFEYKNGQMQENSYDVWTINCISSADLVNWTDHGAIPVAGRRGATNGAASWANNSWAPDAIWKNINGKDKFFLYFADNGSGVGVLTADSPTGPWTDPINKQIISRSTPNCGDVTWLFDPGAYYDPQTGEGYIAFGGGVPDGKQADPGTGRMLKLTDDCLAIDGAAKTIHPPYLFEDSSLIKIGSNWIYSFCHNWNVPGGANINGHSLSSADIGYMYGSNPMGDLTYGGVVFKNTGTQRLDNGGNNHHSVIEFNGQYYVLYHSRQLEMRMGVNGGKGLNYRSPCIDKCSVNGTSLSCNGTIEGVAQLTTLDPYTTVQAETMSNQSKSISVSGLGDTKVVAKKGDWIKVSGVKFTGTNSFTAKGKGGAIRVSVGSPTGDVIAYAGFGNSEEEVTLATTSNVTGTKDIYITFSDDNMELDSWSFE